MRPLRLAYIQADTAWHDPAQNLLRYNERISRVNGPVDLIVLPEMFTTGFTMEPALVAEDMQGPAVAWMKETARVQDTTLIGSLVIREDGHHYNRLVCCGPDGALNFYDKRHLFTYAGEEQYYSAGQHQLVVEVAGWKVMPLICYDLRFPVWSRNVHGYDLLVYVANWPQPRIDAWSALLRARAIENLAYVVGVNRTGMDPNGNRYPGASAVFDMRGQELGVSGAEEDVRTLELDDMALTEFRSRFAFLRDKDAFYLAD